MQVRTFDDLVLCRQSTPTGATEIIKALDDSICALGSAIAQSLKCAIDEMQAAPPPPEEEEDDGSDPLKGEYL
jgi:hypothetical protein